jgi:hypothetical protein
VAMAFLMVSRASLVKAGTIRNHRRLQLNRLKPPRKKVELWFRNYW